VNKNKFMEVEVPEEKQAAEKQRVKNKQHKSRQGNK